MSAAASVAVATEVPRELNSKPETYEERAQRAARRREKRRARNERAEYWSSKLHAFLWVVGSVIGFVLSDFANVCLTSTEVSRIPLNIGFFLFGCVVLAIIRMTLWFPKVGNGSEDFEKVHPRFTLFTTFSGLFSYLFLTIGLWPVYRIFAPLLLLLFWFGMIMSLHFIP